MTGYSSELTEAQILDMENMPIFSIEDMVSFEIHKIMKDENIEIPQDVINEVVNQRLSMSFIDDFNILSHYG